MRCMEGRLQSQTSSGYRMRLGSLWRGRQRIVWLPILFILLSGAVLALLLVLLRAEAVRSGERINEAFAQITEEQTTRTIQAVDQTLQLVRNRLTGLSAPSPSDVESIRTV